MSESNHTQKTYRARFLGKLKNFSSVSVFYDGVLLKSITDSSLAFQFHYAFRHMESTH